MSPSQDEERRQSKRAFVIQGCGAVQHGVCRRGRQPGCPCRWRNLGCLFQTSSKAAGITNLRFHDTRREALTRASKKLTNIAELARASGHRGIASLMVYYAPDIT